MTAPGRFESNVPRRLGRFAAIIDLAVSYATSDPLPTGGATAVFRRPPRGRTRAAWIALLLTVSMSAATPAMERVSLLRDGRTLAITGQVLVEAQDGGLLLESPDRAIWAIQPDELQHRQQDDRPFERLDADALADSLLSDLPDGFRVHRTAHYVIAYNTSRGYAQWAGALFEQLHRAFYSYWLRRDLTLEPSPPLVALLFRDAGSYRRYSRPEVGDAASRIIGYYSLHTNRITTYDLTGMERLRRPGERNSSLRQVRQILLRPEAERTVATIIHEATHQLAFNSGLQQRFADNPMWLSEGLAIYFETPDVTRGRGWRRIGQVNRVRLSQLRRLPNDGSWLRQLVQSDQSFRDPAEADAAYARAWAICYHLIRTRPEAFIRYLGLIRTKPILGADPPEQRLADFRQSVGVDPDELQAELMRAMPRW